MGRVQHNAPNGSIEPELSNIRDLSREELVMRWEARYGHPPPLGVRRGLLVLSAGWALQEEHFGGLSADVRRVLHDGRRDRAVVGLTSGRNEASANQDWPSEAVDLKSSGSGVVDRSKAGSKDLGKTPKVLRPGDRLVREWNGKTHVIEVVNQGYVFDGQVFKSLTAIARAITGAHWSGPRFFGL